VQFDFVAHWIGVSDRDSAPGSGRHDRHAEPGGPGPGTQWWTANPRRGPARHDARPESLPDREVSPQARGILGLRDRV